MAEVKMQHSDQSNVADPELITMFGVKAQLYEN